MTQRDFIHEYRLALLLIFFGSIGACIGYLTGEGAAAFIASLPIAVLCYLIIRTIDIIEARTGKKNGRIKGPDQPPR